MSDPPSLASSPPTPIPPFLANILASHLALPRPTPPHRSPILETYPSSQAVHQAHQAHQEHIYGNGPGSFHSQGNGVVNGGHHPPPAGTAPPPAPNPLYLPPPALPKVEEDLVPPENFAVASSGVYRSGFPKKRNFKFMETLRLKTVLTLVLEEYPRANLEWCQSQDIQFMQFGIPGNKEPFDNIPEDVICAALVAILDRRNHPILIHCNKGKHRTGCLIGCIRRLQSWSLTSIFDEYRRFSAPKSRAVDQQFIDLFDIQPVWEAVMRPKGGGLGNLPGWGMLTVPKGVQAGGGKEGGRKRVERDVSQMKGL